MKNRNTALWFLLVLAGFLFFFQLGDRPLRNPDEGRYAEIAREMATSNNWVVPQLYGVDYLRKPVLFYWLVALSFKLLGFSEYAARFVPALFGLFTVAAVFLFARKMLGEHTAIFSSLLLMTHFWFLQVGRYLLIDMVFSFFVTCSLFFMYLGMTDEKKRPVYFTYFYAAAGLAFLSKGVAAVVIPAVAAIAYMSATRKSWGFFAPKHLFLGILVFLLVAAPWFVLISMREPEFLKFFFIHEHFQRFASKDFEHQAGPLYYLWVMPLIFLPWSLLVLPMQKTWQALRSGAEKNTHLFLLLSSAGIVLFYSLSRTKLPTYILPAVPLLCIMLGAGWRHWAETPPVKREFWITAPPLIALVFLGVAFFMTSEKLPALTKGVLTPVLVFHFEIMAGVILAACVAALRSLRRGRKDILFYLLVVMMAVSSTVFSQALAAVNHKFNNKLFAEILSPKLQPGDEVYIYDHPGPFYDFRFYLGYPVKLVGLAGELELAKDDPELKNTGTSNEAWVTREEFWKRAAEGKRLYCLIRKSDYGELPEAQRGLTTILSEDPRKVLFGIKAAR